MKNLMTAAASLALLYAAQLHAADFLTVIDENNQPVANAMVMLGYEPGNPFQGNVFNTDGQGTAQIPADWKDALPLTVQAPGFIAKTFPGANPGAQNLQITHQEPQTTMEVKGTTTDYGRLVKDGKVDFGLVIPAIRRQDMLSFDVSTIVSPQNDTISIIGNDVNIPSNVTLPDQTETYIFPIELNKPDYRVYLRTPGQYEMAVTHGQFPLQRVVDDIRGGKSFLDVINYFDFKESGTKSVNVQGNMAGVDLSVSQTKFTGTIALKAPAFDNSLVMMSLGLIENNGLFLPTDVKRLTPNQSMNLKSVTGASNVSALSLLMENANNILAAPLKTMQDWFSPITSTIPKDAAPPTSFNRLSFALTPAGNGAAPQFLPLIAAPTLNGQVLKFDMPQAPAGVNPLGMYITLSEIETIGKIERRTRMWEIMSEAWVGQFELPKIDIARRADRKYRWEVLFMGSSQPAAHVDLNTVTHATRNTLDL
jgi:hypothetical protein